MTAHPITKLANDHYMRTYEELLGPIRFEPLKMLELGIADGDSLYHWRDYLPAATIVGLDTRPFAPDDASGRLAAYQGEQQDRGLLTKIKEIMRPRVGMS